MYTSENVPQPAVVEAEEAANSTPFRRAIAASLLSALPVVGLAVESGYSPAAASETTANCHTETLAPSGHGTPVDAISPSHVVIIGHGGSTGWMRHNGKRVFADFDTVRSELRAVKHGADGAERDYQQTRTDELVDRHDPLLQMHTYGAGTNGRGIIRRMSLSRIQRYHVTPHGERITTPAQDFKALENASCFSTQNEQKGTPTKAAIIKVDEAIKSVNYGSGATFSASEIRTLKLDREIDPDVTRLFIKRGTGLPSFSLLKNHAKLIDVVGLDFHHVTTAWVKLVHKLGIRVSVRSMKSFADYRKAQNVDHVDQVVVDNVDRARYVRWQFRKSH